jgi:hypothetical protein
MGKKNVSPTFWGAFPVLPSGYVKIAIENGDLYYSGFTH